MHVRALLAVRLALQAAPDWRQHRPWWQSERRIRRKGPFAGRHLPDAEVWWPAVPGGHAGQVWAIETELTAKTAARTAAVMAGLAAAGYDRIVYFTAPAARRRRGPRRRRPSRRPDHRLRSSPGRLYPRRITRQAPIGMRWQSMLRKARSRQVK